MPASRSGHGGQFHFKADDIGSVDKISASCPSRKLHQRRKCAAKSDVEGDADGYRLSTASR